MNIASLGTTGRSSVVSETIKRQKTMEMRDKVRGHGAFSERTLQDAASRKDQRAYQQASQYRNR